LDVLRAESRTESLETSDDPPPAAAEPDPADAAELSELHERLRDRVARLPASQSEALNLWADGFSYPEIAQILETPEGNVRVLVHRALTRLRNDPIARRLINEL
jgi:RNA polymerase sigma factor (sigma-70 family)